MGDERVGGKQGEGNRAAMDIIILAEGKPEIEFVREILAPRLRTVGYSSVSVWLITGSGAGICAWRQAKTNIEMHLRTNAYVTTMVDYYGLPDDWPGRAESNALPTAERADFVERAILQDMGMEESAAAKLIPYVMLHEFEAMLFSDCQKFAAGVGYPELAPALQEIRDRFPTPEDIDDSPEGAPSKRIESLVAPIDVYRKPVLGVRGAGAIGLDAIQAQCPHFAKWFDRLESVARST